MTYFQIEIRYSGPNIIFGSIFVITWEQCKLDEITNRVLRKNKNLESELPLTISAQEGLVDQEKFFNKRIASKDLRNYLLVENGEFAYNKSYSSGYPWGVIKRLYKYPRGVVSSLYIVFSPILDKIDSSFLVVFFESELWHSQISKRAAEGARNHGLLNIQASDFFDIDLTLSSLSEQRQIGQFFKDLDNLITLHQCKLEN
ncbi:restriction endonuclease subunit S [Dubosiella newyorkensis]|uniref:restriction endonuclease subunit S n=1 Tax=Dubosiella newyorkensis TaxID=1862672 RepID=UPI00272D41AA|nr:restriction endonuclease subunit S [Dubosiella newyorkensis]